MAGLCLTVCILSGLCAAYICWVGKRAWGEIVSAFFIGAFLPVLGPLCVQAAVSYENRKTERRLNAEEALEAVKVSLLECVKGLEGFNLGNSVYVGNGNVLVAINQTADALILAYDSEKGIQSRTWQSGEIVSVEVVTDIQNHSLMLGGIFPLGDHPVLGLGGTSWSELKGVWLKILVRDVQHPWLVFAMPDITEAEKWRGIITLMTQEAA